MLRRTKTWNIQLLAGVLAVWMLLCAIPQPILATVEDLLPEKAASERAVVPQWEIGTIAYANGQNKNNATRLRVSNYLKLEEFAGVSIDNGYMLVHFIYDKEYKYLYGTDWLGNGVGFSVKDLRQKYPNAVYFRVALCSVDGKTLTVQDLPATGIKFYAYGEEMPEPSWSYESVMDVPVNQDGAIFNNKVFLLNGSGTCQVYDLEKKTALGNFKLDQLESLVPHANSVCFSDTYYAPGDAYPLLYVNIYNTYSNAADRAEGTCCVYRLMENAGTFSTKLVQVIRIGFTEDISLWKSKPNNGDIRPYGNFVVDTDTDTLYAFVMRDADKTTRFFQFALPSMSAGTYNDTYECNVVVLEKEDILSRFDTPYMNYMQGCCYTDGKIIAVEGFGSNTSAPPVLRVIDLQMQKEVQFIPLSESGLVHEPEFVYAYQDKLYYAAADQILRVLTLPEIDFSSSPLSVYNGKTLSILGDSISTYAGVSNNTSYNSTIGKNSIYYSAGALGGQQHTWWQQTIDALGMRLLVNNSWSGSTVLKPRQGAGSEGYLSRCVNLHNDKTGETPDVIAVFLGTNDFSYYQSTLGTADISYATLISPQSDGSFIYATPQTTCEAYAIMLHKMQQRYPDAEIFCMTLLPRREPNHAPTAFNSELAKVIAHFGCTVVDLEHCGITPQPENFDYYISDKRVHPGAAGMDKMSEALISAMLGQTITLQQVTGQYTGTNSDNSAAVALPGAAYTTNLTVQPGYEGLRVTVTMGGEDITKTAYANGRIHIPAVTGEIVIAAKAVKLATDYRWEFADSSVSSVTTGGNKANALTLLGGSLTDGVLQGAYFRMAEQVELYHHRPWVVEWSAAGNWSGMLLSKLQSSNAAGNEYFFKSNSVSIGLIAFGQWQNGQYMNYGIRLADYGVDTSARHIYRLENRIAKDGSNAVHLLVDGVDFGVMAHHYIGTTDQSSSANWANGHDLTFGYIGTNGHVMNGCDLDYLQVWEAGDVRELPLRYDDRYDVSGKSVEIINAGSPSSYKVGYGVAAGTLDDAVITLDGDTLIATGIGTAQVKIDGVLYEITVTAAPLSLILIIGQSNAEGMVGNANQSIACKNGQVYSTYAEANGLTGDAGLTVNNASNYVPSALTGAYSTVNVNGTDTKLSKYPVNSLTESGSGKYGIDSGIAYEWVQQAGEKVWIVNAAHGASSISSWQRNESNFEEAAALMDVCQSVLQQEIKAGHFTMSHMGYYWCQGCADEKRTAEWYTEKYIAMHQALKQEMAFDADLNASTADATIEFGGIILVMAGHENATGYRKGTYEDASEQFFATFKELEMRGPRVAQIWLASNPSYPDIHLICTLAQDWVTMPDGSDGVAEYFATHYQNGKIDYPTQKAQSASWYTPTTPAQVKNSIHYYQVGYNEVGREAARNMLYVLGVVKKPEVEVTVRFVDWTGYQTVDSIKSSLAGSSSTLVVPLVSPCYESKNVTYTLSNNLTYEYYDLLDKTNYGGQLTADIDNVSVSVVGRPLSNYRFELNDNGIMESVTNHFFHGNTLSQPVSGEKFYKLQEPIILMHDKEWRVEFNSVETTRFMALTSSQSTVEGMFYFFKSKSGTGVLSIGQYKDGVYQNYGLKQSEIAVDWTQPHVFCFRNILNEDGSNTIHIYTDDIWVGTATNLIVNDVLQSTNDTYLSERDLVFTHLSCGGFALNADQMTYLEVWEDTHTHIYKATITPPTCTEQGYTTHTCECGDSYADSYVPATGHKFSVYTADGNATYETDGTKTALCDHGCGAKDTVADVGSMLFPEQVTSSIYTISDGILGNVPTGTTVSALLAGLDWGKYCTVFDANGNAVDMAAKVATGMVVKLLRGAEVKQILTIAVRGDTNGDGTVTLTDFVQIKAHLLQKQTLTGAAVNAADYSADGSVTVTDFMQVKALLLQMPA